MDYFDYHLEYNFVSINTYDFDKCKISQKAFK